MNATVLGFLQGYLCKTAAEEEQRAEPSPEERSPFGVSLQNTGLQEARANQYRNRKENFKQYINPASSTPDPRAGIEHAINAKNYYTAAKERGANPSFWADIGDEQLLKAMDPRASMSSYVQSEARPSYGQRQVDRWLSGLKDIGKSNAEKGQAFEAQKQQQYRTDMKNFPSVMGRPNVPVTAP